eukprot:SAG31_NODE_1486_length_8148_cov_6.234439_9_plen_84_part_00
MDGPLWRCTDGPDEIPVSHPKPHVVIAQLIHSRSRYRIYHPQRAQVRIVERARLGLHLQPRHAMRTPRALADISTRGISPSSL